MTKARARLSSADIASIVVAGAFAVFAANLTLIVVNVDSDYITKALLTPMWPGLKVAYVMTGGSNVSTAQQDAAPYIAAWIKALLYAAGVLILRLLWRQLTLDYPDRISPSDQKEQSS